ncbi:PREDICTED: scarecrow-like protein 1 [Tarenaya hassleriana]|uniref:scarecrow-like protein 1 n=1 Tax=Tarenaya hassleriana TaxID=28532 RepID=UPI00053C95E5|nr:PREDICTED: scarecrow-like protein 1 [Tarenaya hassleriana]XP_010537326.1 PREDICTED: scarecrow-like protein 1 [Tarenaya hassleriana]
MSLVRSAEPSAASYRNPKLYSLKENSNNVGLSSSQVFASDRPPNNMFLADSYSSQSYEKYFLDSPTEELIQPLGSGASMSSYGSPETYPYQTRPVLGCSMEIQMPFDSSFPSPRMFGGHQAEFLQSSTGMDVVEFDEDKMRSKIQELERVLFEDDNDGIMGIDQLMDIDNEWSYPNEKEHEQNQNSPKESSSADSNSNLSSVSISNKEVLSQTSSETTTPRQILLRCARVLSEGKSEEALSMINELRQVVSIQGDPSERIAAYMVEGLAARMAASGKFLYKALKCKEPPSDERLAAMQVLFEVCPCFKFGFLAANGAIIEALEDEEEVHIIDFDINQGNQYITLIRTIAGLPGKTPRLRLTGIDDPESVQRTVGGLRIIGLRLEQLAEDLGVPFRFTAVPSKTSIVTPSMLGHKPGETLIVNFAFQLHHMPDESVSTVNERDQLLHMVKSLNPKLVTVVEQDVNTNTAPFFPRFLEAYDYYSAVFESLDITLPRDSQDRMNVERQCLARDIVNVVACEGEERIERYEVAGKWRARMMMAGFASKPMSLRVTSTIQSLIKQQYCDRYKLKEEMGELHFSWEEKSLIVASAWR